MYRLTMQVAALVAGLLLTSAPVLASGFAYISNAADNSLSIINTNSNTVVSTVVVGTGPFGVAVVPDGKTVYTANLYDNTISVIDAISRTLVDTIPVARRTRPWRYAAP